MSEPIRSVPPRKPSEERKEDAAFSKLIEKSSQVFQDCKEIAKHIDYNNSSGEFIALRGLPKSELLSKLLNDPIHLAHYIRKSTAIEALALARLLGWEKLEKTTLEHLKKHFPDSLKKLADSPFDFSVVNEDNLIDALYLIDEMDWNELRPRCAEIIDELLYTTIMSRLQSPDEENDQTTFDQIIAEVAKHDLYTLDLRKSVSLMDAEDVIKLIPLHVLTLNLSGNADVSAATIRHFTDPVFHTSPLRPLFQELETLDVRFCHNLDDKGIPDLKKFPNLKTIYIEGTQISEKELLKALPRVTPK